MACHPAGGRGGMLWQYIKAVRGSAMATAEDIATALGCISCSAGRLSVNLVRHKEDEKQHRAQMLVTDLLSIVTGGGDLPGPRPSLVVQIGSSCCPVQVESLNFARKVTSGPVVFECCKTASDYWITQDCGSIRLLKDIDNVTLEVRPTTMTAAPALVNKLRALAASPDYGQIKRLRVHCSNADQLRRQLDDHAAAMSCHDGHLDCHMSDQ